MKHSSKLKSTKPMKRSAMKKPKANPTHTTKDGRLVLSARDWTKMKREMWESLYDGDNQKFPWCGICERQIFSYYDFEPDHIIPRGLGGGTRDDRPENIQPSHRLCNRAKGSKRVPAKVKQAAVAPLP